MAKDPAFLFYPNDWIGGTMGMTFEEKGAYMELLMLQFNRGHMSAHMIGQAVGQIFGQIQDKFSIDEKGLYYNARLDEEKEKRKTFTQSRSNNLKGTNQYTKKSGHMGGRKGGHTTSRMEDENENVNNTPVKDFKEEVKTNGMHNDFVCYDAEAYLLGEPLIFEQILMKAGRKKSELEEVKQILHKYHLYMTKEGKYPVGKKIVPSGFEYWLLNENKFSQNKINGNGTYQQPNGKTKFNAGQHELLDSLEQDLSARGVKVDRA